MGEFVLKNISFSLSRSSIGNAIKEVKDLQKKLGPAIGELIRELSEKGVEIAQIEIASMGAVGTSALLDSISSRFDSGERVGQVFTMLDYAVFVEYGTGIVGENSPHPGINDNDWIDVPGITVNGETYDTYNQNEHGSKGWWYPSPTGWYTPKDGVTNEEGLALAWTMGMPSRPFMYNTMRELEIYAEEMGGTIIAQYIQ